MDSKLKAAILLLEQKGMMEEFIKTVLRDIISEINILDDEELIELYKIMVSEEHTKVFEFFLGVKNLEDYIQSFLEDQSISEEN